MKERLTGAIILVVLIVLLVPELLSGPKGASAPAPAGSAPNSSEEPPLRSYTINLGDDSHSRTGSAGSTEPSMPQPSGPEQPTAQPNAGTTEGASTNGSATNGAAPGSASTAPQAAEATKPAAPPNGVATSGQTPTPSQSSERTADVAQPAPKSISPPPPAPKPSAPAAKPSAPAAKAAAPVAKTAAPAAKTTKGHPAAAASAAANTAQSSESGWAVQLGVFASRENAERLALDVRVKGFKASVSPVTSGSRKLYRVRVGPAPDRSAAQELQGRLKAAGRPGGTVVPYS